MITKGKAREDFNSGYLESKVINPKNMEDKKTFKVKHHVATGQFSFLEFEVEADLKTIVSQARWLALQFKDKDII
jgi:hypothetical protein